MFDIVTQGKRDLTLGATKAAAAAATTNAEKKKFVPNLNVQRNVKKEPDLTAVKEDKGGKKGRKENKHEKREKFNKDRPALIQTLGSVFADGESIFKSSSSNKLMFFLLPKNEVLIICTGRRRDSNACDVSGYLNPFPMAYIFRSVTLSVLFLVIHRLCTTGSYLHTCIFPNLFFVDTGSNPH